MIDLVIRNIYVSVRVFSDEGEIFLDDLFKRCSKELMTAQTNTGLYAWSRDLEASSDVRQRERVAFAMLLGWSCKGLCPTRLLKGVPHAANESPCPMGFSMRGGLWIELF